MSKERLEEMKHKVIGLTDYTGDFIDEVTMKVDVYYWFYEQAERVDELERKNYDLREDLAGRHSTVEELNEKIDELWKQNKRYRESIESALEQCVKDRPISAEKILARALESESHE